MEQDEEERDPHNHDAETVEIEVPVGAYHIRLVDDDSVNKTCLALFSGFELIEGGHQT